MRPFKHIFLLGVLLSASLFANAQTQILYAQYRDLPFYNPSVTNVDGDYHHLVQAWSHMAFAPKGFEERYDTQTYEDYDVGLRYQGRLKQHFFSASYHYDGYSFFHQHTLGLSYGHEFIFEGKHHFSIGGRLQMNLCDVMLDKLSVQADWLKTFQMRPDIDFGIQYHLRGLHIGLSIVNLAGSAASDKAALIVYERRAYANLSYDFALDKQKNVIFSPHLLFYYGQHTIGAELGIDFNLWKYVHFGYTFRSLEMRHITTVGMEYKGFVFDFAADAAPRPRKQRMQMMLGYKF